MSKICPKCNSQTNDAANFCSQCGQPLTGELLTEKPHNPAWIAAMREKITDTRRSELFGFICGVIFIVLTTAIFLPHTFLNMKWETMDWVEVIGFFILSMWGFVKSDSYKKQKEKLINQLEKGK